MAWKSRRRDWLNNLLCLGLVVSLTFLAVLPATSTTASRPLPKTPQMAELRGVWLTNVSSAVLFAPWGVNRALKRLAQLNFNAVYPVVWNRGHTFFPSSIAQQVTGSAVDPFLRTLRGGSDVLAEIVREGHRLGLSVSPWFEYGFIVPAHSPLVERHPDWLTQNRQGQWSLAENESEGDFQSGASPQSLNPVARWLNQSHQQRLKQQVWLNPFHPEVQKFVKGLILEVAANYEVDGIQLDDHFGLPVELGYDAWTVQLYQREHQGRQPPDNPRDGEWMRWRAAKLTAFMAQIAQAVKTVRPAAKISLSPNSHRFSYQNYLQDWKTWVQRGLVNELVLQVYRDDLRAFAAELSKPAVQFARRQIPVSVGILTGTWNRPVDIPQIQQQVAIVRERGFSGVSFFYWETLWSYLAPESPRQRRRAFQEIFAQPAGHQ